MLRLEGISVSYGAVVALSDVDLIVDSGETVAILGPSGSGKTTLLRVAAGLTTPDRGRVFWDGEDVTHLPPHLRRFGLVFQDFALFPHLTVAGNVGFGLRMAAAPQSEMDELVESALRRVGLGGLAGRRIGELSGGQAQRVALARTLATDPRLLLLDEPLGSLDPALRDDLRDDLAAMLVREPTPALLVTHDTDEAFALADRIAVMDKGRLVRQGTPQEVWEAPGTATTARLLGQSVVSGTRTGVGLSWGGATVPADGESLWLAVQPDALTVDESGPLVGTVVASTFSGPGHRLTVDIDGEAMTVPHARPVAPGTRVRLTVDAERIAPVAP